MPCGCSRPPDADGFSIARACARSASLGSSASRPGSVRPRLDHGPADLANVPTVVPWSVQGSVTNDERDGFRDELSEWVSKARDLPQVFADEGARATRLLQLTEPPDGVAWGWHH